MSSSWVFAGTAEFELDAEALNLSERGLMKNAELGLTRKVLVKTCQEEEEENRNGGVKRVLEGQK